MASKKSGKIVGPSAGASTTGAANVPGTPAFVAQDTNEIDITWSESSNGDTVEYLIYVEEAGVFLGYVQADTTVDSGAVWQTKATWGASSVPVTGLTARTLYKFKIKARNEADVETDYSSLSANMIPGQDLTKGTTSDNVEREVTGGNTRIYGTPTWTGDLSDADTDNVYYGDLLVSYVMQNDDSDTSSLWSSIGAAAGVDFSEDYDEDTETGTWYAATEGSGSDGVTGLTSSPAGVTHTYSFDSAASCGTSENKSVVYLRLTPKDAAGDAGTAIIVGPFGIDNRPAEWTWTLADGKDWNKDTTPTFQAEILDIRSGIRLYPAIRFYREEDGAGSTQEAFSFQQPDGWEYEICYYSDDDVAFVDSDPDTITKTGGTSFVTLGFQAGQTLTVSGSASNDGTYTIATVAANVITLDAGDTLTAESAGETVRLSVFTTMTADGILAAYCGVSLRTRYTPTTALAVGNYIATGEPWENEDLS